MAAAAVPLAIKLGGLVAKLTVKELLQHSLRLKNAKNENAAIPPVVEAYDADLAAIVDAYNNAHADAATCIAALQELDQNIYNQLRSGTISSGGGVIPGVAWNDATGFAGKCDKTCTAGCCVYYGDLGPPLSLAQIAMGGRGGKWGTNDPRWQKTARGAVITVPEVFASKYGGQDRPKYTITITAPTAPAAVATSLKNTVNSLLGVQPSDPLASILNPSANAGPLGSVGGPSLLPTGMGLGTVLAIAGAGFVGLIILVALIMRPR